MDQLGLGLSRGGAPIGDSDDSRQQQLYNSKLVELLNKLDETEIPIPPKDMKNAIPIPEFMKHPKKKAAEEEYTKKREAFIQEIKSHLVCCKLWRRNLSWSKAYFERMLSTQRVTSKEQAKRHEAVIQHFRDLIQQLATTEASSSTRTVVVAGRVEELGLADEYLHWAELHQVDIDNSLLGQRPTSTLLRSILSREGLEEGGMGASGLLTPPSAAALSTSPLNNPAGAMRKPTNRPESMQRRLIRRGDLVLAKLEPPRGASAEDLTRPDFVYARVAYVNSGANTYEHFILSYKSSSRSDTMEVYTDPLERATFFTKMLLPLTHSTLEAIGDVRQMEKLVQLPTDRLFSELQQWTHKRTFDTLHRRGIDTKFLDQQISKSSTIFELIALKRYQRKIETLICSPEHNMMLDDIEEHARAKAREFRETQLNLPRGTADTSITATVVAAAVDSRLLYPPVARKVLQQLAEYPGTFTRMSDAWIQKYKGICTYGLDEIKLNQRDLMNGSLKNEMTKWWLDVIDTEVDQFLTQNGYDHDAVPYDYLETPPSDLEVVRRNLELVMRLLQELKEPEKQKPVHELIRSLKAKIVPRMDSFIQQAQIVLTEHFEPQSETSHNDQTPSFALSTIKQLFDTRAHSLDATTRQWIKDMIADLEYLQEMKALEENPKIKAGGGFELGVVPITGLIVGRFVRLDNELRTVLEKFGRSVAPPDREPPHLAKQSSHSELPSSAKPAPRDFPAAAGAPANSALYQYAGASGSEEPPLPFAQLKELKEKERAAKKASWYKQDFSLFGNKEKTTKEKDREKEKKDSPYIIDVRYLSTAPPPPPGASSPPTNSSPLALHSSTSSSPLNSISTSSPSAPGAAPTQATSATNVALIATPPLAPTPKEPPKELPKEPPTFDSTRQTWVEFLMGDSLALNEVAPVVRGRSSRRGAPADIQPNSASSAASSSAPATRNSASMPRMDVSLPTRGDARSPLPRPPHELPPLPPMSAPIDMPVLRPVLSSSSEPLETLASYPSSPIMPPPPTPAPAALAEPAFNAPPPSPEMRSPLKIVNVFSEAAARESYMAHSVSSDYLLSMERAMSVSGSAMSTSHALATAQAAHHARTSSAGPVVQSQFVKAVDPSRSDSPQMTRLRSGTATTIGSGRSTAPVSPPGSHIAGRSSPAPVEPMNATSAPVSSSATPLSASPSTNPSQLTSAPAYSHSNPSAIPVKAPLRQSPAMQSPSRLSGLKTLLLGKKGKDQ